MILRFTIPGPPVPKARARVVNGHAFTPAKTAKYEKHVATVARMARWQFDRHLGQGPWLLDAHYRLAVNVYREANRGDLDNMIKSVSDSLNEVLFADDARIVLLSGGMFVDELRPRVEVEIEVVSPPVAVRRAKGKRAKGAAA